jgi:hypothetical protein
VCAETIRVSFWLRRFVARTILYDCTFEPLRLKLSWSSVDEIPFRVLGSSRFGVSSMDRGSRPPDIQTFAASPAEPGELPFWFSRLTGRHANRVQANAVSAPERCV